MGALLVFAVVPSYVDGSVPAVPKRDPARQYGWSENGYADLAFYFRLACALSRVVPGRRLIDPVW